MGLEQYVINFVTFVNNIVIPFLLGIAFLFFVVNAIRFFVVGGANPETKEKARSLAVYGVLAFVLVMTFWGITALLTSSLGLNQYATSDNTCFDYKCGPTAYKQTDGGANVGGNFGTGVGDDTSLGNLGGGSQDSAVVQRLPEVEQSNPGDSPRLPILIGSAGKPQKPSPTRPPEIPIIPGRVAEGIEDFASTFDPTEYGSRLNSVIQESVDVLADPNANTEDRAKAVVLLEANGYITESDLASYVGTLNTERSAAGLQPLDMKTIRSGAKRLPDSLVTEISQTQNGLLDTVAEGSRRLYDIWGAPDRNAQVDALALVEQIYNQPADPDRIAMFDMLLSSNEAMNQDELAVARSRMIEEINAERFYAGIEPLGGSTSTENPTRGDSSNTQSGSTNSVFTDIAQPAETSVNNVIPDVQNNFLTTQIKSVGADDTKTPIERLKKAKAFEAAGFITPTEYQAVADSLNNALVSSGQQQLSQGTVAEIEPTDGYVETIVNYKDNVETSQKIITDFYGFSQGNEVAANQINKIFNSQDYTLEERRQAADKVYTEIQNQSESTSSTGGIYIPGSSPDELAALEGSMYSALGTEAQLSAGEAIDP